MPHHTPLIGTLVVGLVAAFVMGAIAQRLRVSPVAGYLFAGVIVGPFTPGYVADTSIAAELAEIGVILLMFGVGLHFSLRDLMSVRRIALPGALVQIAVATLMGMGLGWVLGWTAIAGFGFGLALSVASTVVLLRALEVRSLVPTERGRIAVGWLIVEDLAMVVALVMFPVVARIAMGDGAVEVSTVIWILLLTFLKVAGFVALMLLVGKRILPMLLHWVVHTGSRELFRLAVLAIALGVAFGAAMLFDVSFALGAFIAGMILGESQLSRRAAEESLPFRDAFAVLFFVSVGMLFDPAVLMEQPGAVLATVAIIIVGKSVAAYAIVRGAGYSHESALTISASLAQIGEFSFILAGLGAGLGILPEAARDLILAGAILSILANPFIFSALVRHGGPEVVAPSAEPAAAAPAPQASAPEPVLLIGFGRVGRLVGEGLARAGRRFRVIEERREFAELAERLGGEVIVADAIRPGVLKEAGIGDCSVLVIAIPEGFEAGQIAERARRLNPGLTILARAHSEEEVSHLSRLGADRVVMGEREIAARMLDLLDE